MSYIRVWNIKHNNWTIYTGTHIWNGQLILGLGETFKMQSNSIHTLRVCLYVPLFVCPINVHLEPKLQLNLSCLLVCAINSSFNIPTSDCCAVLISSFLVSLPVVWVTEWVSFGMEIGFGIDTVFVNIWKDIYLNICTQTVCKKCVCVVGGHWVTILMISCYYCLFQNIHILSSSL